MRIRAVVLEDTGGTLSVQELELGQGVLDVVADGLIEASGDLLVLYGGE